MFDFLPNQPAYQYPDLVNIVYVLIWAFFLSSLIAITHRLTFRGDPYPSQFFQSLVLGAIVTAMVMMAIGDSLARGLGVFGAMAIIRFRTRIDDPRNVLFLFAALSSGLAVGVYGFLISFAGTIVFCVGAAILYFSPFRAFTHGWQAVVLVKEEASIAALEAILLKNCWEIRQTGTGSAADGFIRYEFSLAMKGRKDDLVRELMATGMVKRVRIRPIENPVAG
ncbi:MAG: DUF4956 domain-containing protein [Bacteroidota bacterium]